MTNFKTLYIILITVFYSCNNNKNIKEYTNIRLDSSISSTTLKMNTNHKNVSNQSSPTLEDIIQASEGQILFYKTATKEELIEFLGISKERVNSVSDKEFDELVREENIYLYKNLIDELKKGKTEFEVVSKENNIFKISFKEKGNDSFAMIMSFELTENGLIVAK